MTNKNPTYQITFQRLPEGGGTLKIEGIFGPDDSVDLSQAIEIMTTFHNQLEERRTWPKPQVPGKL